MSIKIYSKLWFFSIAVFLLNQLSAQDWNIIKTMSEKIVQDSIEIQNLKQQQLYNFETINDLSKQKQNLNDSVSELQKQLQEEREKQKAQQEKRVTTEQKLQQVQPYPSPQKIIVKQISDSANDAYKQKRFYQHSFSLSVNPIYYAMGNFTVSIEGKSKNGSVGLKLPISIGSAEQPPSLLNFPIHYFATGLELVVYERTRILFFSPSFQCGYVFLNPKYTAGSHNYFKYYYRQGNYDNPVRKYTFTNIVLKVGFTILVTYRFSVTFDGGIGIGWLQRTDIIPKWYGLFPLGITWSYKFK